ncbi:hypothetical protein [Lysinibacillus sp. JNUCC 51]|uniref:hypothetical protein n=1 Tax=Lysinibacillus sp. JNUCC-51 TaxID=2792479 RepID=UPI001935DB9E|nr:hypothetical protein JNUCC51_01085 [Lysinibacillus sp. JNUCC-51]
MNPCEKNCSCEHCQKCGIPSRVIKGVESCEIRQLPTPAYGNFFQTNFITLDTNDPMPWNGMGETAGITLDPDTVTIRVTQGGPYYIDYNVLGNQSPIIVPTTTDIILALFLNGTEVNPIQTRYGTEDLELDKAICVPISGGTIISIPSGGTIQLRNVGPEFATCDNGTILSASINLIKLN